MDSSLHAAAASGKEQRLTKLLDTLMTFQNKKLLANSYRLIQIEKKESSTHQGFNVLT